MEKENKITRLSKEHNHSHFWIEDSILYQSYKTIRGLRYRSICAMDKDEFADADNVNDYTLKVIAYKYFNETLKH